MEKLNENNLYIRILEFSEAHPKGFSYNNLKNIVKPNEWENNIILRYFYNAVLNNYPGNKTLHETIFLEIRINTIPDGLNIPYESMSSINESQKERIESTIKNAIFTLKYDAYFNYIDFRELQEALKSSKEAKGIAIISIIIAIITGLFQVSEDSLLLKFLSTLF